MNRPQLLAQLEQNIRRPLTLISAPAGKEKNWLETTPDKTWFICLRMYGATEPWLKKTWHPGEIELVK